MPRKKVVLTRDRIDFLFRCQTKADTRDGKLLRYLQSDDTELPLREMFLLAAAAFWTPFAHKHHNDLSPEELEQCVSRAIYQLQTQIVYLEESFGSRRIGCQSFNAPRVSLPTSSAKQASVEQTSTSPDDVAILTDINGEGEWQDLNF